MAIRILDLFCGCGGISWGLAQSSEIFKITYGIDNDSVALKTFAANHSESQAIHADLSSYTPQKLLNDYNIDANDIDCIVGGPPCQGFSKNVPRSQRYLDDPRNMLIQRFLDYVDVIQPPIVLIENVAEIVNAFDGELTQEVLTTLRNWGYNAEVRIFDAANYGVPQHRKRAFFFAVKNAEIIFPKPTHISPDDILPLFDTQSPTHISVWEVIGDLPSLQHGDGKPVTHYAKSPQNDYQHLMRETSSVVQNHVAKKLSDKQYARLSSLAPGEGARELPEHLRPKSHYSGAYGRLTKDMVARTITRWMFHAGSGRFGHPVDIRTITIREAARLQSFSDDFVFEGTFTQASSQLGNAVPPLLAGAFAPIIEQYFESVVIHER